jgi:glucokinase
VTSAVGLDVGGSKIAACLIDVSRGTILASCRASTDPQRGGRAVLSDCSELLAELIGGDDETPVGVGICELVSLSGRITSAETIDWRGIDLEAAFGRPVVVESDVRAAAVGEARFGAGRGRSNFVYLNVGTGVAFTLMQSGTPYMGARGNALILGAPPVERSSSGKGLAQYAGVRSAEEVFGSGDSDQLIRNGSRDLGRAMAWLVNALDPELIVVGGGLGLRDDYRLAAVAEMRSGIEAADSRTVQVVRAELGADAGAIGVAVMAAERSLSV